MSVTRNEARSINERKHKVLTVESKLRADTRKTQDEVSSLAKERDTLEAEILSILEKKASDHFDRQDKDAAKYSNDGVDRALSHLIDNIETTDKSVIKEKIQILQAIFGRWTERSTNIKRNLLRPFAAEFKHIYFGLLKDSIKQTEQLDKWNRDFNRIIESAIQDERKKLVAAQLAAEAREKAFVEKQQALQNLSSANLGLQKQVNALSDQLRNSGYEKSIDETKSASNSFLDLSQLFSTTTDIQSELNETKEKLRLANKTIKTFKIPVKNDCKEIGLQTEINLNVHHSPCGRSTKA